MKAMPGFEEAYAATTLERRWIAGDVFQHKFASDDDRANLVAARVWAMDREREQTYKLPLVVVTGGSQVTRTNLLAEMLAPLSGWYEFMGASGVIDFLCPEIIRGLYYLRALVIQAESPVKTVKNRRAFARFLSCEIFQSNREELAMDRRTMLILSAEEVDLPPELMRRALMIRLTAKKAQKGELAAGLAPIKSIMLPPAEASKRLADGARRHREDVETALRVLKEESQCAQWGKTVKALKRVIKHLKKHKGIPF